MVEFVAATGSTNADLAARLTGGEHLADGFWLRAGLQTGGKGRSGRDWISPEGNLYCSTVVNLQPGDPPPATLSLVAGLAVHDLVLSAVGEGAGPVLKWPNDLLIGGAKVAGILCEMVGRAIVIGIGVNLANAPCLADRAATSIREQGGEMNAEQALDRLAAAFVERLAHWRAQPLGDTLAAWEARATPRGTPITVHADTRIEGAFDGLENDGSLRLRLEDGSLRAIYAGDVILREND